MTSVARGLEAVAELLFVMIVGYGITTGRLDTTVGVWTAGLVLGGPALVRAALASGDLASSDTEDRRPPEEP